MKSSSYTLLSQTVGDGSTLQNLTGDPVKASAYYLRNQSLQTISWYLNGFDGTLTIEGTLDASSSTTNWITLYTVHDGSSELTENDFVDIEGNFTWIRVNVADFTTGEIAKISMSY